eukprot:scaffold642_cov232-Pinguiococcus_pyrenoidosus.AAC.1
MLIFRLIDRVANSVRLDFCGHELSVKFEAKGNDDLLDGTHTALMKRLREESGAVSCVSEKQVMRALRRVMYDKDFDEAYQPLSPSSVINRKFEIGLYTKLYTVMLGLMKDVLERSEIRVLDDRVTATIVPKRGALYREIRKRKRDPSKGGLFAMSPKEKELGFALVMGATIGVLGCVFLAGRT